MDTDKILLEQFIASHPAQAAQAIEKHGEEEIAVFMEQIPLSLSSQLIHEMKTYKATKCLQSLKPELMKELMENIDVSLAESLLRQFDIDSRSALLDRLDPTLAETLRQKLTYDFNTVGALMTPSVFALDKTVLVRDAIEIVRQEKTNISSHIYVINEEDKLEGRIILHELFFADPDQSLYEIAELELATLLADMSIKSILNHPAWNVYRSLPVVDRSGKLVGVLSFEAVQSHDKTTLAQNREVLETSNSLGELYRIGLSSLLQSIH